MRFNQIQLVSIAVIAAAGFILSGLWFVTGQKSWKGVMLERRVNQGETISEKTLLDVWDKIKNTDQARLTGGHVHLPGLAAHLIIANNRIPLEKRARVLLDGEASIENALAREPAHSAAWARLAWLRYLQHGPSQEVLDALRMSVYTAPAKKTLVFWRIRMAAYNREYWDEGFESLIRRQVTYASRISQRRLDALLEDLSMEDLGSGPRPLSL